MKKYKVKIENFNQIAMSEATNVEHNTEPTWSLYLVVFYELLLHITPYKQIFIYAMGRNALFRSGLVWGFEAHYGLYLQCSELVK